MICTGWPNGARHRRWRLELIIRPATLGDAPAIHALHSLAFGAAAEADLVDALDLDGDVLASLVAQDAGGEIIGHVLFSRMAVTGDGAPIAAAALAPVSTHPDHQRQGVAALLIEVGHEQLRAHGTAMVFVLGDPAYYARFGYDAAVAAPFASPYAGDYFMALRLDSALVLPQAGTAHHAPAFAAL